jgi:uncharacterized protein (TIGR03435 family)
MKRNENVEDILKQSLPSASAEEAGSATERVFSRLRSGSAGVLREDLIDFAPSRTLAWRWLPAVAAAAILIGVVWAGLAWQGQRGYPMLETTAGSRAIPPKEMVRSMDGAAATLTLPDGSRIEMRAGSELSWERHDDGTRIRLNSGAVIVNAAKRRSGHLYVQTKDVTVSVVGTVFFVNAEEEGSRVAVIEGEVRVQKGAAERKLRRGEQVTTGPSMEPRPVTEEVSWSQNAPILVAQLQQPNQESTAASTALVIGTVRTSSGVPAAGVRVTAIRNNSNDTVFRAIARMAVTDVTGGYRLEDILPGTYTIAAGYPGTREIAKEAVVSVGPAGIVAGLDFVLAESRKTFEETSVRPSIAVAGGGERGQGATVAVIKGCTNPPRVDPQQFVAINTTLYNLIGIATGYGCSYITSVDLVEGGPGWIKSDLFDVRGLLPPDSPRYTMASPELQAMVRALLESRFKLAMRREMKERSFYELRLGNSPAKLRPANESAGVQRLAIRWVPDPIAGESFVLVSENVSMEETVGWIARAIYAPVVDRTGLKGKFSFEVEYSKDGVARPLLPAAFRDQLGLRLEKVKGPIEVFVIDHVDKPTEN